MDFIDEINYNNLGVARQQLIMLCYNNQKPKATESISNYLKTKYHFKSIRNDNEMEIWVYKDGIYIPNGKSYILEFTRDLLGMLFTTYLGNQVIAKIYTSTFIDQHVFFEQQNTQPYLLPVQNGLLNIKTKKLYDFTPEKYFFNKINAIYDPKKDCHKIKQFIKSIVSNEKDFLTIQEIFGFSLLREYRYEKGFMLYGEHGRNGKSKLISIFKEFLGVENCSSVSLQDIEKEQFTLINLHNKLINISADLSEYAISNTGMYKALTGRDIINANRKGQSHVKFVNYAKMIFACNDLPIVKNFSSAFSLRWVMIDFPYRFLPQHEIDAIEDKTNVFLQNTNIVDELISSDEFSGLLNFALEGFDRLEKHNKFSNETNSNVVRKYWLRKSNSVSAFIEDFIEVDYDSYVTKRDFRFQYNLYCQKNNIKQLSDQAILITLTNELGCSESQIRLNDNERVRVWLGIRFKDLSFDKTNLILKALEKKDKTKTTELEELFNFDTKTLSSCLSMLENEGKIFELPKGYWRIKNAN